VCAKVNRRTNLVHIYTTNTCIFIERKEAKEL